MSIEDHILELSKTINKHKSEDLRTALINFINELINKDFAAMVQLLYRIDVDEEKLKRALNKNSGENSAVIIADLIIEKQIQKNNYGKKFSGNHNSYDEEKC